MINFPICLFLQFKILATINLLLSFTKNIFKFYYFFLAFLKIIKKDVNQLETIFVFFKWVIFGG